MRFVNIEQLDLPRNWQARADKALDALRAEIADAETAALAAGHDPAAARKAAIKAGLEASARQRIWQELSSRLSVLRKGKCWYSESKNPTADKNVDHFRPKRRVEGEPLHEGYWWLAFTWRNYRFASQWCNQHRVDDSHGTTGGKTDQFPLCPGSTRAMQDGDDIELEIPELLDPIDPRDWKLLTFRPDGYPIPARQPGTVEHQRAKTSINAYHLDCHELVVERRTLAGIIQRLVQELERLHSKLQDPKMKALYRSREADLLLRIDQDSEYSAAALAYAKAEIFKLERGQQVKREWLEEILS
jgi:hypothetical protein